MVLQQARAQLQLLIGRGVHLGELPAVLAATYGERPAVDDPAPTPGLHAGGIRTFAELEDHIGRLAAAHRERGADGRVLIAIGNRIDIVLHALALARLGAIGIPVNPRLTRQELAAVSAATGATSAVVDGTPADPPAADDAAVETADLPDDLDTVTATALGAAAHRLRPMPPETREPGDVAMLLTTSGTTGTPKAAALTSRGLLGGVGPLLAAPVGFVGGFRGGRDQVAATLPLTHVMGLSTALGTWCAGLPLLRRHRFRAEEMLDLIEQQRPNVVVAVPTMYADLEAAGAADRDLRCVQLWVSAADVMPLGRARRFQRYGAAVRVAGRPVGTSAFLDIYGMVELSGPAAVRLLPPSAIGALPAPPIAKTLPGFEVRVVDEDEQPLGPGRVGELQFRGPGVLQRYEGSDAAGTGAEGWLSTGDHGRVFPGGLFQFAGRARDRLKVGGFSVFPAEVEHELRGAPDVREIAVVGVPDDRLGERPVAVVVPGADFDEDAFLGWAADNVAGYRRPRQVVTVEALPLGGNHKVDRAAATAIASEALTDGRHH